MTETSGNVQGWLSREGERLSLEDARLEWDPSISASRLEKSEEQRAEVLQRFPLAAWPDMPLERYALGTPNSAESFCRWMEFRTQQIASIRGGNAMKLLIYKRLNEPGWYFDPRFADEEDAWQAVRAGFVRAFGLAAEGRFAEIGSIDAISSAFSLVTKSVYTYFPEGIIPICSHAHQQHFWEFLGGDGDLEGGVPGAQKLLRLARERLGWPERSPAEIARFLYWWADPRTTPDIVKISPGANAEFWNDCRANGYVRVGWGPIGDLLAFGTKEEFRGRFNELFRAHYGTQNKATEKANELWSLRELQPGDRIVANRGISEVVGIGTVVEPGYEWLSGLGEYSQVVHVQWDDTTAREIDPIRRWGVKTVAPVSQADYQRILQGRQVGSKPANQPRPPAIQAPPAPAIFRELDAALRRKGQVILYGPPGTGKTYTARRFSVWWLAGRKGDASPESLLVDRTAFERAERALSTTQTEQRVWWVVANPKEWHWDQLFKDGTVDYRYGRLKGNYAQLQPGDLVIGYLANPDKRIVALARIKEGLHQTDEGQGITLEPLARVSNGPTYDELLKHPTLSASEPMRFRNQGTLFALTSAEAGELLAWLIERDPALPVPETDSEDTIGPLTRITFHPSYGYEDFIEGYKPIPTGTGQLDLRLMDGVFKRICLAARAKPNQPFLVLIDEINRGNIAKIFGELVTLLEQDKRDLAVVLPQSGQTFSVPPNVYLIGTMNTADRSIKLLDAALRRRFAFIELMPDVGLLQGANVGGLDLGAFLAELNRRVAHREGREKQIGHSFFLDERGQPLADVERFADQFRHEIVPLLQEYAYEDYRELVEYLGSGLVNAEEQRLVTEKLEDPAALVAALLEAYPQDQTTVDDEAV